MWIKICGVTRDDDVSAVTSSGADAIGFNFFPKSKRFVSNKCACGLIRLAKQLTVDTSAPDLVGVFVNSDAQTVKITVMETGINVIQIHGDETVDQVVEIHRLSPDIPLIRAIRVDSENAERLLEETDCLHAKVPLAAILLDTFVPGEFGGTGNHLDLRILQTYATKQRPRLILAGGITPENATKFASHPIVWGLDTASGVETSPGIKDAVRVHNFLKNVRMANPIGSGFSRIRTSS